MHSDGARKSSPLCRTVTHCSMNHLCLKAELVLLCFASCQYFHGKSLFSGILSMENGSFINTGTQNSRPRALMLISVIGVLPCKSNLGHLYVCSRQI